jgi:hypothetical protein
LVGAVADGELPAERLQRKKDSELRKAGRRDQATDLPAELPTVLSHESPHDVPLTLRGTYERRLRPSRAERSNRLADSGNGKKWTAH